MPSNTIYTVSCISCRSVVSTSQLSNHHNSKQCLSGKKFGNVGECKYCHLVFDGTFNAGCHVRYCVEKSDIKYSSGSGKQLNTPQAIEKRSKQISQAHQNGLYIDAPAKSVATRRSRSPDGVIRMSDKSRENSRIAALKSKHQRVSKRSHKFVDKRGRIFTFDSSWEDITAMRLDELDIKWDRPTPIQYELDGMLKNYFPDFHLIEHNLYLDPKNPYVEDQQKDKLIAVSKLINLRILRSVEECKNFHI